MQLKSLCCNASITEGRRPEYPLGGRVHVITYKVDVCEECGGIAEPVEACDHCGEPAEPLIKTELGDWCAECVRIEVDQRAEQFKKVWGVA